MPVPLGTGAKNTHIKTHHEFHAGKTTLEIVFWEKGPLGRGWTKSPIRAKLLGATLGVPVFKNEVPNGTQAAECLIRARPVRHRGEKHTYKDAS